MKEGGVKELRSEGEMEGEGVREGGVAAFMSLTQVLKKI